MERIASDGGTVIECNILADGANAPAVETPKRVQLFYVEGEGFKIRRFGEDGSTFLGVESPLTTKGDLFGFTNEEARIAVGDDGQILTADSEADEGVSWQDAPAAGGPPGTWGLLDSGEDAITANATITLATVTPPATGQSLLILVSSDGTNGLHVTPGSTASAPGSTAIVHDQVGTGAAIEIKARAGSAASATLRWAVYLVTI